MTQEQTKIIKQLSDIFQAHADAENALKQKQYLKNQFNFIGIKTPLRRSISKDLINQVSTLAIADIFTLCDEIFALDEREYLYFVQDVMMKIYKRLSIADIQYIITNYIANKGWWENCDNFVASIRRWTELNPQALLELHNFCLASNNLWVRRCGILLQLHHKQINVFQLENVIFENITNKDFFIQKAIGWVLRQTAKDNLDIAHVLALQFIDEMTSVAKNEVKKFI